MELKEYLETRRGEQAEMAKQLGVSASQMSQMVNGSCPISNKRCVLIEALTNGEVTRRDLRPDDWLELWPELAQQHKPNNS